MQFESKTTSTSIGKELLYAVLAGVIILTLSIFVASWHYNHETHAYQAEVESELGRMERRFQTLLKRNYTTAYALAVAYAYSDTLNEFEKLAKDMLSANEFLDILELTNQGVITHVYPLGGNETIIGFNILADPFRSDDARKAIESKTIYYSGPYALIQSGEEAMIGRFPIFNDDGRFKGFSVVITKVRTLRKFFDSYNNDRFSFQLVKYKPYSNKSEVGFTLYPDFKYRKNSLRSFFVEEGDWEVFMYAKENTHIIWYSTGIFILGVMVAFLVAFGLYKLLYKPVILSQIIDSKTTQLNRQEQYFKSIIERISDAVVLLDEQARIKYHSPSFTTITGYTPDPDELFSFTTIFTANEVNTFYEVYKSVLKQQQNGVVKHNFEVITQSGQNIWIKGTFSNQLHDDRLNGVLFSFQDITAKLTSERLLLKFNRELSLLNKVNDLILSNSDELALQQKVCELIVKEGGYRLVWIAAQPDESDEKQEVIVRAAFGETSYLKDISIRLSDEQQRQGPTARALLQNKITIINNVHQEAIFTPWLNKAQEHQIAASLVIPLQYQEGKVTHAINIYSPHFDAYDDQETAILKRVAENLVLAIRALRTQKEKERTGYILNEYVKELSAIFTINNILTDDNLTKDHAFANVVNTIPSAMQHVDFCGACITHGTSQYCTPLFKDIKVTVGVPFVTIDGLEGRIQVGYTEQLNTHHPDLFVKEKMDAIKIISKLLVLYYNRKYQQLKLEKSEANLRTIFDNTEVGYLLLDTEGNVITYNNPMRTVYAAQTGINLARDNSFFNLIRADRVGKFKQAFNRVLTTEYVVEYETHFDVMAEKASTNYYRVQLVPIKVKDDVIGVCVSAVDITAIKELEIERQRYIQELLNRNKDLEQFAYIVSHNLRSPISNIMGLLQLMRGEQSPEEVIYLQNSLEFSANKLDTVVKDLNMILDIHQNVATQQTRVVNLDHEVRSLIKSVNQLLMNAQATIDLDFTAGSEVFGIEAYINSIFLNLISNSLKYAHPERAPRIQVSSTIIGEYLDITYRDNGSGIDMAKYGSQLFGFYKRFTSKQEGKGLGLFLIKSQIESMGGTVTLESELNQGVLFHLRFRKAPVTVSETLRLP